MKHKVLIFLFTSISLALFAQFPNSKFLEEGQESPQASLNDIDWLAGYWKGEAFGGITEEIWSKPLGGSMMGSFKLVVDEQVSFYELMTITEFENSLLLRIKHFDWELVGWEEKDKSVEFRLVEVTPDAIYFDGLSMKKINENEIKVYVVIENEGKQNEIEFHYYK